jgi:hypothetical protein
MHAQGEEPLEPTRKEGSQLLDVVTYVTDVTDVTTVSASSPQILEIEPPLIQGGRLNGGTEHPRSDYSWTIRTFIRQYLYSNVLLADAVHLFLWSECVIRGIRYLATQNCCIARLFHTQTIVLNRKAPYYNTKVFFKMYNS